MTEGHLQFRGRRDDLNVHMTVHGVDSLVAVELRNWLSETAKARISHLRDYTE